MHSRLSFVLGRLGRAIVSVSHAHAGVFTHSIDRTEPPKYPTKHPKYTKNNQEQTRTTNNYQEPPRNTKNHQDLPRTTKNHKEPQRTTKNHKEPPRTPNTKHTHRLPQTNGVCPTTTNNHHPHHPRQLATLPTCTYTRTRGYPIFLAGRCLNHSAKVSIPIRFE